MKIGTKLVEAVSGLVDNVGKAFDGNFANKEEILQKKSEILEKVRALQSLIIEAQKYLLALELQGNWLQRSWRPILMLCFGFIVMYAYFIQPAFLPNAVPIRNDLNDNFWELLKLGIGGYVIGRTGEKVMKLAGEAYKTRRERKNNIPEDTD